MVKIRIESDKELRESTKEKLIHIFRDTTNLQQELSDTFPKGFTKFDISRFTLTLGEGKHIVSFIEIPRFQPNVLESYNYGVIYNIRNEVDY